MLLRQRKKMKPQGAKKGPTFFLLYAKMTTQKHFSSHPFSHPPSSSFAVLSLLPLFPFSAAAAAAAAAAAVSFKNFPHPHEEVEES